MREIKHHRPQIGWMLACLAMLATGAHAETSSAPPRDRTAHADDHAMHTMSAEILSVLRERVPSYQSYTDQQIALEMQMMGPNEERYLSSPDLKGETGLLVLIHGFGETGNRVMSEAVQPMAGIFPTAMAAGMSMMGAEHIQQALDQLTAAGSETVVVVPMVSSANNTLIYQWQYIFGLRDHGGFYDIPRALTDARVIMADPPAGHPLITQIVLDHALEISENPAKETVFLVAHGPIHEEENRLQLSALAGQARRIKELGGFAEVTPITLQDDAAPDVRARNVAQLRQLIEQATARGQRALIVTDLLAARSIQWKIERDLAGLDYVFSVKGISMHPDFTRWFREDVMAALKE
jgi:sirohydrochlorin cobaltochelatase